MRRAVFLGLLVAAVASGQGVPGQADPSVVLTKERALLVMPPRLVAGQEVKAFSSSPSGRYLVAYQEVPSERPLDLGRQPDPPKSKQLLVWDSVTGTSRTVALPAQSHLGSGAIDWFAGTDRALVRFDQEAQRVATDDEPDYTENVSSWHILDAARSTLISISPIKTGHYGARVATSPIAPVAARVVVGWETKELNGRSFLDQTISVQRLGSDGRVSDLLQLPSHYINLRESGWSADGRFFQFAVDSFEKPGKAVPVVLRFEADFRGYQELAAPADSYKPTQRTMDAQLVREVKQLDGSARPGSLRSWWIKSHETTEQPRALVAEHADWAVLAEGEKYVAFTVNGALFTRQIIELTLEQFNGMKLEAQRAVLVSNAKQVALATLMYAVDNDDVIPAGLNKDMLMPYVKNEKLFEGFVFVFPGGKHTDIARVAETVLGYIEGPGGRAVAYMDGHVEWVPNQSVTSCLTS